MWSLMCAQNLDVCRTHKGGSGMNKAAQELTRRDRKLTFAHPAPPGDRTQGLQIWIPHLWISRLWRQNSRGVLTLTFIGKCFTQGGFWWSGRLPENMKCCFTKVLLKEGSYIWQKGGLPWRFSMYEKKTNENIPVNWRLTLSTSSVERNCLPTSRNSLDLTSK